MFGCTYAGDGNATANVQNVTGQAGSIAEGYTHDYLYGLGPDFYVDAIVANGGTIFFKSQDNVGRAVSYNGPSGMYRAIHSTFIFGALRDAASTKTMLMTQYVDYLSETVDVQEHTEQAITQCTVSPNPFSKLTNISFEVDSRQKSVVSVRIYDVSGRLVKSFGSLPSALGPLQINWDGTDNSGTRLSSGTYLVLIETETGTITKAVVSTN
jgi:hypothetical protein